MSSTLVPKVEGLLAWLEENAFWNSELVEVKKSTYGGIGVFWKLKDEPDPSGDSMILRIPKSSVLSPKNSFLYNLLLDYEPSDPTIDLTQGMHAIVLTFIYEQSLGERSPWHVYLETFEIDENDDQYLPLCLWNEAEKKALFNSECDLLNMLDPTELISFYLECVNFAKTNDAVRETPSVLKLNEGEEVDEKHLKLRYFAKCIQTVISRAFMVDRYHGLSLVPGADLFNHLSPTTVDGKIVPRENVHFVCDDDEGLCERCGESDCGHEEDSDEEDEMIQDDGEEEDVEIDKQNGDADLAVTDLMETMPLSSDSEDSEEEVVSETESIEEDEHDHTAEIQSISMADIERMEDSDAETDKDEEEVSTVSLSGDEDEDEDEVDHEEQAKSDLDGNQVDLAQELSDSSKCCDIIVTSLPSKEHDYELFNTYGNDLSNPYLLQRYGFICPNNPNTTCLLSVQMFAYLKKAKASEKNKKAIELKLDWYESQGFELVNELCGGCQDDDCNDCEDDHDHDHDHDHGCDDDGCKNDDCGGCDSEKGCETQEPPESWQLSPKIQADGKPTKQTKALLHLLTMPFKVFYYKLARAPSERKMAKRVEKLLLDSQLSESENNILKTWVEGRLHRYKHSAAESGVGSRAHTIDYIIKEEKQLLEKALGELK